MTSTSVTRPNPRDLWIAGAVFAVDALGSVIAINAARFTTDGAFSASFLAVTIAVMALQAGALAFRRPQPLLVALTTLSLGAVVPVLALAADFSAMSINGVATSFALFSLGLHSAKRWRDLAVCLAVALPVAILRGFTDMPVLALSPVPTVLLAVIGFLASSVIAFGIGVAVRNSRDLTHALQARAELAEVNAINEERSRIARELHDTTAHHLSAIAIQAQAAQALLRTNPEAAADHLAHISQSASRALADVRATVTVLHTPLSDAEATKTPQPTASDIPALLDEARSLGQSLAVRGDVPPGLPHPTQQCIYRILQEALTNARKHAPGTPVDVQFSPDNMTVTTHGTFAAGSPGRGSRSMRERAHAIGASLRNEPCPAGWIVALNWRNHP